MATRWQRARGCDFDLERGVPAVEKVAEVDHVVFLRRCKADSISRHFPRSAILTTVKRTTLRVLRKAASTQWAML